MAKQLGETKEFFYILKVSLYRILRQERMFNEVIFLFMVEVIQEVEDVLI